MNKYGKIQDITDIPLGDNFLVDQYSKDISQYPVLKADEQRRLAFILKEYRDTEKGDAARNELILSNLRLACKYAKQYYQNYRINNNYRVSLIDLIADANLGLVRALKYYDPEKGFTFGTYAVNVIKTELLKSIQKTRFIRLPSHHHHLIPLYKHLYNKHGENLTDEMLKEELNISDSMVAMLKVDIKATRADTDMDVVFDVMPSNDRPIFEGIDRQEKLNYVYEKMSELKKRDREILIMYFFGGQTQGQISESYNMSKQRIFQIIKKSLSDIKVKISNDKATRNSKASNITKKGNKNERKRKKE